MKVNHLAVIVAAIVDFGLGAAWFTAFAKPWIADLRLTPEQIAYAQQHPNQLLYIAALLLSIVMAYVLAWLVMRTGEQTAARGVCIGSAIGLLVAAGMVTELMFEQHVASFIAIAAGYPLLGMTIMGAIVGAWRAKHPVRAVAAGATFDEARPENRDKPPRA